MKRGKNISSEDLRVYAITDRHWLNGEKLEDVVEKIIKGGATIIQFREKNIPDDEFVELGRRVAEVTKAHNIPLIINDRVHLAAEIGAQGVHVGQSDMTVEEVRRMVGPDMIVGVSTHTVSESLEAQEGGADYLGVGAVFSTSTKDDAEDVPIATLKDICSTVDIPVVAIGGITDSNAKKLCGTGIDGLAVISAIFAAHDPESATARLKATMEKMIRIGTAGGNGSMLSFAANADRLRHADIKAVIFDYDGVVLNSMPMWNIASSKYIRSLGKEPKADLDYMMKTRGLEDGADLMRQDYNIEGTTEEIVDQVLELVEDEYRYNIPAKEGIEEVFKDFKEAGIKMVIATASAKTMIEAGNKRLGFDKYIDRVFTCMEAGANKHKPDVYLKACEYLGTKPEETIVFEDVLHASSTACNAGFPVVGVYDESSFLDRDDMMDVCALYLDDYSQWPGIKNIIG